MRIMDLLKGIEPIDVKGNLEIEIEGIAYDSRKVKKGDIFVCISGYKTDGHRYANEAIKNGAKALVVEKEIELKTSVEELVIVWVPDSRNALSKISSNFFKNPTQGMNIFGVTGTNGKTTITYMIKEILDSVKIECGVLGTISYKIGEKEYKAPNTTPESYELQRMFKEMKDRNIYTCVMEASSHSLALKRVEDIHFNYGIFTNLTPDHLDFHNNFDHYYNSKKKLFQKTHKANLINIDDFYGYKLALELKQFQIPCYTYGIKKEADYKACNIRMTQSYSSFEVVHKDNFLGEINLPIPGIFSIYNAMASLSICLIAGVPFNDIKMALENSKGVPGRIESVYNDKDYFVFVDYAHTPDALEKILNTINEFKERKLICVFGCGGERDRKKRPLMGEIAGNLSDYCIITNDNPRSEDQNKIFEDIIKGIEKTKCSYEIVADRYDAIKRAVEIYEKNDIIILAGKGHETYQVIGEQQIHFDDREAAKNIIKSLD